MGGAYYNEIDPYAAQWLRNLIGGGHIPRGDVDERDIQDVRPDDVKGYTQCHFFAGLGGWAYALRLAGWPDDRPVWTGSCPCQPFSAAGKRKGTADERHLWPAFFHLIRFNRPAVVFGEQVASPDGIAWLDTVSADLEGEGYAAGPIDIPACGFGAPHIRNRLWFVAEPAREGFDGLGLLLQPRESRLPSAEAPGRGEACDMADVAKSRRESWRRPSETSERTDAPRLESGRFRNARNMADSAGSRFRQEYENGGGRGKGTLTPEEWLGLKLYGDPCLVGDARFDGTREHARKLSGDEKKHEVGPAKSDHASELAGAACVMDDALRAGRAGRAGERGDDGEGLAPLERASGPINGFWADAEWLPCRDGKYRAAKPGIFPLAHGVPARVGKLRAAGNAIVPQVAEGVIRAYMEWAR